MGVGWKNAKNVCVMLRRRRRETQHDRMERDPWEEELTEAKILARADASFGQIEVVDGELPVASKYLLEVMLRIPIDKQSRRHETRLGDVMRNSLILRGINKSAMRGDRALKSAPLI
jgi:hypothetical protein